MRMKQATTRLFRRSTRSRTIVDASIKTTMERKQIFIMDNSTAVYSSMVGVVSLKDEDMEVQEPQRMNFEQQNLCK